MICVPNYWTTPYRLGMEIVGWVGYCPSVNFTSNIRPTFFDIPSNNSSYLVLNLRRSIIGTSFKIVRQDGKATVAVNNKSRPKDWGWFFSPLSSLFPQIHVALNKIHVAQSLGSHHAPPPSKLYGCDFGEK